jgi:hypothetical protein
VSASSVEQRKWADHSIDGNILFRDHPQVSTSERTILQVNGGKNAKDRQQIGLIKS